MISDVCKCIYYVRMFVTILVRLILITSLDICWQAVSLLNLNVGFGHGLDIMLPC